MPARYMQRAILVAFFLCAAVGTASGEAPETTTSPVSITRHDAVTRTLDNNPLIPASKWAVEAWSGRIEQASIWENPEVEFEIEEFGIQRDWLGREAEITVGVSQSVPLGKRLKRAREYGEAGLATAHSRHVVTRLAVAADVHRAFTHAVASQERLAVAKQALSLAAEAKAAIAARIEAGALPPAESFRAETDLLEAIIGLEEARAETEATRIRLVSFWGGHPGDLLSVTGTLDIDAASPLSQLAPEEQKSNPHTVLLESQIQLVRSAELREEAQVIPDLTVGLGWKGLQGFQENSLVVKMAMPIPAFNRKQGDIDEARALLRQQVYEAKDLAKDRHGRQQLAQSRLSATRQQYRLVNEQLGPAAEKSFNAVLTGFKEGKFKTLDLLEAKQRLLKIQRRRIALAAQYHLAITDLLYLAGNPDLLMGGKNNEE
jgi:outer membrane protein, heavy metal efflux system